VEDIHPIEESTRVVVVLSGTGTHPLDGVPAWTWIRLMGELDKRKDARREMIEHLKGSSGYYKKYILSNFDLNVFSIVDTQHAIQEALGSKISIPSGSKRFTVPFQQGVDDLTGIKFGLRKGQKYVQTPLTDENDVPAGGYMGKGVAEHAEIIRGTLLARTAAV
jgi:hypothetical protein